MKFLKVIFISFFLTSCIGNFSSTLFGVGVNINLDPRSPGLYFDDKLAETLIMKKIILNDYKQVFLTVRVIDGTAILSGRVEKAEDKLKMTKFAWETAGIKAVRNDIIIADETSFKQRAKDILISSQFNAALLVNKKINSRNYNSETINGKIYVYGMAKTTAEMEEVIREGKLIPDVVEVVPSIILADNLSRRNYL
ncbi:OsmY Predicted periplasmic or secreted lipoprotein [Candidatus Pelagibacterales bacterium]|jgi:osmotically-inducible protein OsmY